MKIFSSQLRKCYQDNTSKKTTPVINLKINALFLLFFISALSGYSQNYVLNQAANGTTVTTCAGKFFGSGGAYGIPYGNNQDLVQTFKAGTAGKQIKFTFKVNIPSGTGAGIDAGDALTVYDGLSVSSPRLALISSSTNPANLQPTGHGYTFSLISTSGALTFRFVSDNKYRAGTGWEAAITCEDIYIAPVCAANPANSPAADFCINAPTICNLDGYCGNTSFNYTVDMPDKLTDKTINFTNPNFNGSIDNNSWVKFIASEDSAMLKVTSSNCKGGGGNGATVPPIILPGTSGLQFQIFEATDCKNFIAVSDLISQEGVKDRAEIITAGAKSLKTGLPYKKLIAGNSYYIMVDGAFGAQCDYTINALSGVKVATVSAPTAVCLGDSVKLIADAPSHFTPTYNWSPSTGLNTTTGPVVIANPTTTTTYTVQINSAACGAVQSLQTTVTINPLPKINLTANDPKCNGDANGSITVTATDGTAPYLYSIDGINYQASNTFTNLIANVKPYTVFVKSAKGCLNKQTVTLTQPSPLNVSNSVINSTCSNSNGAATASPTGGSPNYTYSWNTTPVVTTATATNLPAGSYEITVKDTKGCITKKTAVITNTNGPTSTIKAVSDILCKGDVSGSATVTATGGTPKYTYEWRDISGVLTGQTSATVTNLKAGTYISTITDLNSCKSVVSITIGEPDKILTSFSNTTSIKCASEATGSSTITAEGGTRFQPANDYHYTWMNSNKTIIPGLITKNGVNLGVGKYYCVVTDKNGCSVIDSVLITQPSAIVPKIITSVDVACHGESTGSASASATGGTVNITSDYKYEWSTVPKQYTANATNLKEGTYTVIVKDDNGCSKIDVVTIKQPSKALSSEISAVTHILCNEGFTGSAKAKGIDGTPDYTYEWDNIPGNSDEITGVKAGTYFVTITDANFCKVRTSVTLTEPKDPISANITSINTTCDKNNGKAAVVVTGGTITTGYIYTWKPNTTDNTASVTNLPPGDYTVTITDNNGCTLEKTTKVNATPLPVIAFDNVNNVDCFEASTGSATVKVTGNGPFVYLWQPINQTTDKVKDLKGGTYTVTITDNDGCSVSKTLSINTPETPKELGDITGNFCEGDSAITIYAPQGNAPFQWYYKGVKIAGANKNSISVKNTTSAKDYYVTYYLNDCMHKSSNVIATTPSSYFIPDNTANVFTPNGDAVNATFRPYSSAVSDPEAIAYYAKEFSLKVFDRWGKQIYETTSYNPSWDGTYKGDPVKEGVYYWMASYISRCGNENKKIEHKGFVHLLR